MDDAINFRARNSARSIATPARLTNSVVSNLDLRDVLREISANIRRVMQCEGVGIDLPSPEDGKLRLYALDFPGNPGLIEEGFEPPAKEGIPPSRVPHWRARQSCRKRGVELNADCRRNRDPIARRTSRLPGAARNRRGAVLRQLSRDTVVESDLTFLEQIARQVAIAIENAMGVRRSLRSQGQAGPRKALPRRRDPQRTEV